MKKKIILTFIVAVAMLCVLSLTAFAAPQMPELGYEFGEVQTIEGFTPPSQLFVDTDERVLLKDANGNLVTYPTYYITKDSTTFDVDFSKLNAYGVSYSKSSVVMLEVPDGITTTPDSYFAGGNFGSMVYVQLPGSLTAIAKQLFNNNRVLLAIEFLDGTTPVSVADGALFGGAWNGGPVVKYVKFPNNLTSLPNSATFVKSPGVETIVLGESCVFFGSMFNESAPKGQPKYIYASAKLFEDLSTMEANPFGTNDKYHNGSASIVLYYTGTKAQAEAILAKGAELMTSNYIFATTALFDANSYDVNELNTFATQQRDQGQIAIVYNYNRCEAFYGGVHNGVELNSCQLQCDRCGEIVMKAEPEHSMVYTESFTGERFFSSVDVYYGCQTCEMVEYDETIAPSFHWVGYSAKTFGDAKGFGQQYVINQDALTRYIEVMTACGKKFSYGVVAAGTMSAGQPLEIVEGVVQNKEGAQSICFDQLKYDAFFMNITGIDDANLDANLVCCAYVQLGEEIIYLDNNQAKDTAGFLTYNMIAMPETKEDEE